MSDKKENALAYVGIQLGGAKAAAVGHMPSDEDLIMLFYGRLDETRKAQVLSHIANAADVYERWIHCVEVNSLFDERRDSVKHDPVSTQAHRHGWAQQFKELLFGRRTWFIGGGFAATFVVLMSVTLVVINRDVSHSVSIDLIYQEHGVSLTQQWAVKPRTPHPTTQSTSRSFFVKKSRVRVLLETGFGKGIDSLGEKAFSELGISKSSLADTLSQSTEEGYIIELGRLAAISSMQCEVQNKQLVSEKLSAIASNLLDDIKTTNTPEIASLKDAIARGDSANEQLCHFSDALIEIISK
ncbi:MAG: hypothetical protein OEZ43_12785 [Gammaproteobacteria bacterium]|nr:hypothetical protein [Gammaproteobacteria bacterium]